MHASQEDRHRGTSEEHDHDRHYDDQHVSKQLKMTPKMPARATSSASGSAPISPRPVLLLRKMKDEEIHFSETLHDDFAWCADEGNEVQLERQAQTPPPAHFRFPGECTDSEYDSASHVHACNEQHAYRCSRGRVDSDGQAW